jgi:hypothetical protein
MQFLLFFFFVVETVDGVSSIRQQERQRLSNQRWLRSIFNLDCVLEFE